MAAGIEDEVRAFIREELEWSGPEEFLGLDASLIDAGVVDSLSLLELGQWVGDRYGFKVDDTEMTAANFETISAIIGFVRRGTGL